MRLCALACCALMLIGCTASRLAKVPMDTIDDVLPGAPGKRVLLVMLPGAYDGPRDFITHGFVEALRDRALAVDVIAVDSHAGYFTGHTIVQRLHQDVILPARARGYRSIWFVGISLGGYGSLLYAAAHAGEVDGIIALAPFLGTRGIIAEIDRAGGLGQWAPGDFAADDYEREFLVWLKQYRCAGAAQPPKPAELEPKQPRSFGNGRKTPVYEQGENPLVNPRHSAAQPNSPPELAAVNSPETICLGYGAGDRFAAAHRMLAACLAPGQVWQVAGGHDWPTWKALWVAMLDAGVLARAPQR